MLFRSTMSERKPIGLTIPYRSVFPKKDYKLPKEWVGLTDEEMKRTCYEACSYDPYAIARAIEAKLKEKNT